MADGQMTFNQFFVIVCDSVSFSRNGRVIQIEWFESALVEETIFFKGSLLRSVPAVCSVASGSLRPCGLQPARLLCPWDALGKNTGVGSHVLLQAVFLTQGSNSGLQPQQAKSTTEPPGKPRPCGEALNS